MKHLDHPSPPPPISLMRKWRDFAPSLNVSFETVFRIFTEAQISSGILFLDGMFALSFPSTKDLLFLLSQSSLEPLISVDVVGTN